MTLSLAMGDGSSDNGDIDFMHDKPYREILGVIQFGAAACCPDLAYSANVLSQFSHEP